MATDPSLCRTYKARGCTHAKVNVIVRAYGTWPETMQERENAFHDFHLFLKATGRLRFPKLVVPRCPHSDRRPSGLRRCQGARFFSHLLNFKHQFSCRDKMVVAGLCIAGCCFRARLFVLADLGCARRCRFSLLQRAPQGRPTQLRGRAELAPFAS